MGSGESQAPIVSVRAAGGDDLLAYCKAGRESSSRKSVYVYDAYDEFFAHIMRDPFKPCYVFTSGRIGYQLFFDGNFDEHGVSITNEQREQLADTEPCEMAFDPSGQYYKLRVVSEVDVGIM